MIATKTKAALTTVPDSAQKKLNDLIKELSAYYLERQDLIKLIFTGLLSGHHVFIGGLPGTGKTHLVRTIANQISKSYGYLLFGAETTTDQIIGPVDPVALMHDKQFKRNTNHGLLKKQVFCADEVFKCNTPALNTQLGILNGDEASDLELYIGLSNEIPKDRSLDAFWDRLALRYWIDERVSRKSRKKLMTRTSEKSNPEIKVVLTEQEIEELRDAAESVTIPEPVIDAVLDLIDVLKSKHGIDVSERKTNQVIPILKAFCVVCGDAEVSKKHLSILEHVLWNHTKQRDVVAACVKDVQVSESKRVSEIATELQKLLEGAKDIPNHAHEKKRSYLANMIGKTESYIGELDSLPATNSRNAVLAEAKRLNRESQGILAELLLF